MYVRGHLKIACSHSYKVFLFFYDAWKKCFAKEMHFPAVICQSLKNLRGSVLSMDIRFETAAYNVYRAHGNICIFFKAKYHWKRKKTPATEVND